MKKGTIFFSALICAVIFSSLSCFAADKSIQRKIKFENRLALVIGNGAYTFAPLKNPPNDANDMAAVLKSLGFEVDLKVNANLRQMEEAVRRFGKKLRSGGQGLFYFSGHGMQVNGLNYLLPVDASIESESDVRYEAVDAGQVLGKMRDAGNPLNIVILDACRNNPFARSFRDPVKGLARMDAPKGSLIAFATGPGSVAKDGEGRNGTYTAALLKYIQTPGLTAERLFKQVRIEVNVQTGGKQIPLENTSLMGDFYFAKSSGRYVQQPGKTGNTRISVDANVAGATVLVDGTRVGMTPLENATVAPGRRLIRVEAGGYEAYQRRINIKEGRTLSLQVVLDQTGPKKGSLTVYTSPADTRIRILNIAPKFEQGMALDAGRYHVEVSANGYQTHDEWIDLALGEDKNLDIRLEPMPAKPVVQPARLRVDTTPSNATIRFKNFNLAFYQGIELEPGSYYLKVSANGYESQSKWITLSSGTYNRVDVRLNPIQTPVKPVVQPARLRVDTTPSNATIRFKNFNLAFYQGIELEPGSYCLKVSANGYESQSKWITLSSGTYNRLDVRLNPIQTPVKPVVQPARLLVDTTPSNATIRFKNSNLSFYQGIELEPGSYCLKVSANGYESQSKWITLSSGTYNRVDVRLNPIQTQ